MFVKNDTYSIYELVGTMNIFFTPVGSRSCRKSNRAFWFQVID